jgi:hypothetical protein
LDQAQGEKIRNDSNPKEKMIFRKPITAFMGRLLSEDEGTLPW